MFGNKPSIEVVLTYDDDALRTVAAKTRRSVTCNAVHVPLDAMDAAYKRWLDSTRQFYAAPVVSPPQIRQSA